VPVDAIGRAVPKKLQLLSAGAVDAFDAVRSKDWRAASTALARITAAWAAFRTTGTPKLLAAQMRDALDRLRGAVGARNARAALHAAFYVSGAGLDLQLRYRPPAEVDLARFELWARRLEADAAGGDRPAVLGDVATLEWIRDRIPLESSDGRRIDDQMRSIEVATKSRELTAAAHAAARLLMALPRHPARQ
jgi:hypothetical protein